MSETAKKAIPSYTVEPLRRFLDSWEECHRLLHLSMRGVSVIRAMPKAIRALHQARPTCLESDDEEKLTSLESAEELAAFATKECDTGFPMLHAQTLIAVWGAFEASIEDLLVGLLVNEPTRVQHDGFRKIRISVADLDTLGREDQMRFVLDELRRECGTTNGVDKFERLLQRFDLAGPVADSVRRNIWELNHVRNVIVHRASLADRRLTDSCPWLNLKAGDCVTVTHESLNRYSGALSEYTVVIIYRLAAFYGVDMGSDDDNASGLAAHPAPPQS